jgi:hypothetical protein
MHTTQVAGTTLDAEFPGGTFAEMVQQELRNGGNEAQKRLSQPELIPFWHDELIRLKQELEVQLAEREAKASAFQQQCLNSHRPQQAKKEWFEHSAEHKRWRASVIRFRYCVEVRLRHVKQLLRHSQGDTVQRLSNRLVAVEERLKKLEERS